MIPLSDKIGWGLIQTFDTPELLREYITRIAIPGLTMMSNTAPLAKNEFVDDAWEYARTIIRASDYKLPDVPSKPTPATVQDALAALDSLVRWCDSVDGARSESPALAPSDPVVVEKRTAAPAIGDKPAGRRSTSNGEAKLNTVGALVDWHKFKPGDNASVGNTDPIKATKLAELAKVGSGYPTYFFKAHCGQNGHRDYKAICADTGKLINWLKSISADPALARLITFGRVPPGESERDED